MSVKWLRNNGNRLQFWVFTGSVQSLSGSFNPRMLELRRWRMGKRSIGPSDYRTFGLSIQNHISRACCQCMELSTVWHSVDFSILSDFKWLFFKISLFLWIFLIMLPLVYDMYCLYTWVYYVVCICCAYSLLCIARSWTYHTYVHHKLQRPYNSHWSSVKAWTFTLKLLLKRYYSKTILIIKFTFAETGLCERVCPFVCLEYSKSRD